MNVTDLAKPKSAAPGQYLGFALQPVRLCHYLFEAPDGCSASLEHIEDVALHLPDGRVVLEQTKSSLTGNPASDRSKDLWNTLANWADICVAGTVDSKSSEFRYYVTPVCSGDLVKRLHSAGSNDEAMDILKEISTPKFIRKKDVGAGPHITRFIAAGDEICSAIILNFRYESVEDPILSIRQKLQATLPAALVDDFCASAIGRAKSDADECIRSGSPPIIDVVVFRRRFQKFVRRHNLAGLLTSASRRPCDEQIDSILHSDPTFLKQLAAVNASAELKMVAVADYLRTAADKTRWAADGLVLEESFDDLDATLKRHHTLQRDEVEDTDKALTPEERGRALYRRSTNLQLPLDGQPLPTHFIPGAFNDLADNLVVGWHPNYEELFSEAAE